MEERDLRIRVGLLPLPSPVRACSSRDGLDCFTVGINQALSSEEQEAAFLHEIRHIWRRDHDRSDVQEVEALAHQGA